MKLLILMAVLAAIVATSVALKNEICGLPHSSQGMCIASFPAWTYDSSINKCIEFIYEGCGGNKNLFGTKTICEDKCLE